MVEKIIKCLLCNCGLVFRLLSGRRIRFSIINLVSPFSSVRTFEKGRIHLGKKVEIRPNTEITARKGQIEIGDNCFINRNCMVVSHEKIVISNNVTVGPGTVIYDHDHDESGGFKSNPVIISSNVWIGANVTILKGVIIGENSTIAAGSVICKNVPSNVCVVQKKSTEYIRKDVI